MNYEKIEQLTSNLRIILNLIRDYNQELELLIIEYDKRFNDDKKFDNILTKISNCEAQIEFNKNQYKQTINQINELLK